jgi:hypothetical protein
MNEKKFISSWVSKLASANIKNFPGDFISLTNYTELKLPGKTLLIGEEFFGKFEIITPDGNSVLHTENYLQAKFVLYANRNTPELIRLPKDENEIRQAVQKYELYIDSIIKENEIDYKKTFPEEKNSKSVVNEIFRQLNLVRV